MPPGVNPLPLEEAGWFEDLPVSTPEVAEQNLRRIRECQIKVKTIFCQIFAPLTAKIEPKIVRPVELVVKYEYVPMQLIQIALRVEYFVSVSQIKGIQQCKSYQGEQIECTETDIDKSIVQLTLGGAISSWDFKYRMDKRQIRSTFLFHFKLGRKAAEIVRDINDDIGQGTTNERSITGSSSCLVNHTRLKNNVFEKSAVILVKL
ncbi:unnamed protein product [Acanthoscelides obtectus]|uniref:Mos1 transposase HTH domain-containing protein n=1 Tax=Acanthoscelides obtectus TaxID=200917 RepID=A0A9P0KTI7_ACAOB|nr:unnamed protein product [Acanthoscelides obtectus]CAK1634406.1 Histone-lysine N-methyltransferase SETMAR [Acanthoscelides obtectus]